MGFLDRAKQAAAQAAEQAKAAADQTRQSVSEGAHRASTAISDPATADKARQALSRAKHGISTAIDRIDPNVLADVIVKATALQERANAALKAKGSPYRVSEVAIGAAIPPSVTFSIARTDDPGADVVPAGAVASTELLAEAPGSGAAVQALDGTMLDEATIAQEGD
ncbi:MAG: hypothetical protein C0498_00390 [Anaerolinea sp.]|nr:hypothetical protein [Anaerolinea sp.]